MIITMKQNNNQEHYKKNPLTKYKPYKNPNITTEKLKTNNYYNNSNIN